MSKRVLLTGMAGFAGAHIAEHILHNTDWTVIGLDRLTYAGTLERLVDTMMDFGSRMKFVFHDFRAAFPAPILHELEGVDYVIHNGGETHVERSLVDPQPFVESNVLGTMHVLNACRQLGVKHVVYVSTDEVHGPAPEGHSFKEDATIRPSNPYSASKAGAEALAYSYWRSFMLPVTITRTMNLFGERQYPEKFIPMVMRKVLNGERVTIHGARHREENWSASHADDVKVGSRKWLHARNQADGLLFLLQLEANGRPAPYGGTFHIAGEERTNLEIAQIVASEIGKPLEYEIVDFHSTRPGHDLRYSLDDSKLRGMGWQPPIPLEESLRKMVRWTLEPQNEKWLAVEKAQHAVLR